MLRIDGFVAISLVVFTGRVSAEEKPSLVGIWDMQSAANVKVDGSVTMEFFKDGKIKMAIELKGGKASAMEGTYKLDGETLTLNHFKNGKNEAETATVITLTAEKLVIRSKGSEMEFKRRDAADTIDLKKLIGVWQPSGQEGTALKFTDDGKMVFMQPGFTIEGRYRLDGKKLIAQLTTPERMELSETLTIKELTADRLRTVDSAGKEETLKRVK
jgi:uncharacterized protein (TIGR03066 family)